jgi:hypothetical protein
VAFEKPEGRAWKKATKDFPKRGRVLHMVTIADEYGQGLHSVEACRSSDRTAARATAEELAPRPKQVGLAGRLQRTPDRRDNFPDPRV